MEQKRYARRRWLAACGAGAAVAVAGCLTDSDDPEADAQKRQGGDVLSASEWPMHNINPQRTGHHPTATPPKTTELERYVVFHTDPGAGRRTNPAISGNTMYLITDAGDVHAFNKYNGDEYWSNELDDLESYSRGPIVHDGTIYVTRNENVVAFDAETGDQLWEEAPNGFEHRILSVTPTEDTFYIIGEFELHRMDPETGETQVLNDSISSNQDYAAADDERIYSVYSRDGVQAHDQETGEELWEQPIDGNDPTVADGLVVVGSKACDAETGEEVWRYDGSFESYSCSVADGVVYGAYDDSFKALDLETGDELWENDEIVPLGYSPTIADGVVYLTTITTVYGLDANTGDLVVEHEIEDDVSRSIPNTAAQTVVSEDMIYSYSGRRVLAFEEKSE